MERLFVVSMRVDPVHGEVPALDLPTILQPRGSSNLDTQCETCQFNRQRFPLPLDEQLKDATDFTSTVRQVQHAVDAVLHAIRIQSGRLVPTGRKSGGN